MLTLTLVVALTLVVHVFLIGYAGIVFFFGSGIVFL